jgi:hypothetical protein
MIGLTLVNLRPSRTRQYSLPDPERTLPTPTPCGRFAIGIFPLRFTAIFALTRIA